MTLLTQPTLHTFVKRDSYEVRHLLIAGDDPSVNAVSQIVDGVHSEVATGTQSEMHQKEHELVQQWSAEGFEEKPSAFESLSRMRTLLTAMGYKGIYDGQFADVERRNLTGFVPLEQWPGRTAQDGTEYEYALETMQLIARPKLEPVKLNAGTGAEFAKAMSEVMKRGDSLGPTLTFLLTD